MRPKVRYAIGEAMKIDDRVPNTTPKVMAKANGWILLPPRKRIQSNTIKVDTDVLMVRVSVWLIELLKSIW